MTSENISLEGFLNGKTKKVVRKKKCRDCFKWKSITEFHRDKNLPDGFKNRCSECSNKRGKKNQEKYKRKNENRNPYNNTKKKCSSCGKTFIRNRDNWFKHSNTRDGLSYYCKECSAKKDRIKRLKYKYNLTEEEYEKMMKKQNNKCKICGVKDERMLHVDHNHKNGELRGLLCRECNRGIGYLKDNPFVLFRAIKYLRGKIE